MGKSPQLMRVPLGAQRTVTPASRTSLVVAHSALTLASALPHRGET
jgi:hypothetical protein